MSFFSCLKGVQLMNEGCIIHANSIFFIFVFSTFTRILSISTTMYVHLKSEFYTIDIVPCSTILTRALVSITEVTNKPTLLYSRVIVCRTPKYVHFLDFQGSLFTNKCYIFHTCNFNTFLLFDKIFKALIWAILYFNLI